MGLISWIASIPTAIRTALRRVKVHDLMVEERYGEALSELEAIQASIQKTNLRLPAEFHVLKCQLLEANGRYDDAVVLASEMIDWFSSNAPYSKVVNDYLVAHCYLVYGQCIECAPYKSKHVHLPGVETCLDEIDLPKVPMKWKRNFPMPSHLLWAGSEPWWD
jgi:hypothetical protein